MRRSVRRMVIDAYFGSTRSCSAHEYGRRFARPRDIRPAPGPNPPQYRRFPYSRISHRRDRTKTVTHVSGMIRDPCDQNGPRTGWLRRQDSNLGMAESKSAESVNDNNSRSGNERGSPSNSINGLGFVPERDRPASTANDLMSDDDSDLRLVGMGRDHLRRGDPGRHRSCSGLLAGSPPMIELLIDPASSAGLFVGRVGTRSSCEAANHSSTVPEHCWRADTIRRRPTTCDTRTRPRCRLSRRPLVARRGWASWTPRWARGSENSFRLRIPTNRSDRLPSDALPSILQNNAPASPESILAYRLRIGGGGPGRTGDGCYWTLRRQIETACRLVRCCFKSGHRYISELGHELTCASYL